MKKIIQRTLTGERALFQARDLRVEFCTFIDGESPLKESKNIELYMCSFKWRYPLWYSNDIKLEKCTLLEMARAGIWYTHNICVKDCIVEGPKNFRRCSNVKLEDVNFHNANETIWNCNKVKMENVNAKGDYFAMNSENIEINNLNLVGKYSFDGAKNVTIKNSKLLSKDAFWNSENVTVIDSYISGEYLGWNAKNLTLINCTVESLQGMCYIDNLIMKNCRLVNTTLAFEYCSVKADIIGKIDSVLNPSSGYIICDEIETLIIESDKVDKDATSITIRGNLNQEIEKKDVAIVSSLN